MTMRRRPPGIARTLSERARAGHPEPRPIEPTQALGGMVEGLQAMMQRLAELAGQAGTTLDAAKGAHGQGEKVLNTPAGEGRMVFGWNIRFGTEGLDAQPFGHVRPGKQAPEPDAPRQPIVDVFEEDEAIVVIAEVPGIEAADIEAVVTQDGALAIEAKGERRFSRIVPLPGPVLPAPASVSCRNGILEVRLARASGAHSS